MTAKHEGKCRNGCDAEVVPHTAVCRECYSTRGKAGYEKRKLRRALAGLCGKCEEPSLPGMSLCSRHLRLNRESRIRCFPNPKRTVHCSECGGERHNVQSCPKNPDNAVT